MTFSSSLAGFSGAEAGSDSGVGGEAEAGGDAEVGEEAEAGEEAAGGEVEAGGDADAGDEAEAGEEEGSAGVVSNDCWARTPSAQNIRTTIPRRLRRRIRSAWGRDRGTTPKATYPKQTNIVRAISGGFIEAFQRQ
jgi:hypothetical protein